MSGEWTGAAANRNWRRQGWRGGRVRGDAERGKRLYEELKATPFLCDACGGMHPLSEHRECRASGPVAEPCVFAARSLYCVRPGCGNPNHQRPGRPEPAQEVTAA